MLDATVRYCRNQQQSLPLRSFGVVQMSRGLVSNNISLIELSGVLYCTVLLLLNGILCDGVVKQFGMNFVLVQMLNQSEVEGCMMSS